jgi:hypothetical protein
MVVVAPLPEAAVLRLAELVRASLLESFDELD